MSKPIWHQHKLDIVAALKPAPKPKPRGVVARFLAGESVAQIAFDVPGTMNWAGAKVEAILRRALAKKDKR